MHVFHLKDLATPTHPEIALTLQRWRRANNSGEHRHDGVEIVFVLSGSGVNFLDGRPFPIIAGDLYVVNRGAVHSFYSNNELIFYNLLFSFSLFSRREQEEFRRIPEFERVFAAALTRGAGFDKLSLPPAAAERLRELFEALNRELRTAAPGSRLGVRATLMLLIVEICRCAAAPPSPLAAAKDNHHSPLTRIIDFLNANFRRPLDLSELAEAADQQRRSAGEKEAGNVCAGKERRSKQKSAEYPRQSAPAVEQSSTERHCHGFVSGTGQIHHFRRGDHRNRRPVRIRRLRLLHPGVPRRDRGDSHAISEKNQGKTLIIFVFFLLKSCFFLLFL